jgi:MoxR-like ATPase
VSARESIAQLQDAMQQSIIGQAAVCERMIIALLADGHVLMEGLPGLAKTRAIKSLAKHLEADFSRIQFTPDLLPSDVTGSEMYFEATGGGASRFEFRPGPVFANLVLADEINRAPAKVQAALLEAMEERQVTVAGTTHEMPELFWILATQNPVEQEGTYPLPEAQMDRFLMHVQVGYPAPEDEVQVLRLVRGEEGGGGEALDLKLAQSTVLEARGEVRGVGISETIERYIVDLVNASRSPESQSADLARWIRFGASPRGGIALDRCSRAYAWLHGSDQVLPEHVQAVAPECLRHRIAMSYEASADGVSAGRVVEEILQLVAVA